MQVGRLHTSHALDARCLRATVSYIPSRIVDRMQVSVATHLLKLGCPGVCEFGAAFEPCGTCALEVAPPIPFFCAF